MQQKWWHGYPFPHPLCVVRIFRVTTKLKPVCSALVGPLRRPICRPCSRILHWDQLLRLRGNPYTLWNCRVQCCVAFLDRQNTRWRGNQHCISALYVCFLSLRTKLRVPDDWNLAPWTFLQWNIMEVNTNWLHQFKNILCDSVFALQNLNFGLHLARPYWPQGSLSSHLSPWWEVTHFTRSMVLETGIVGLFYFINKDSKKTY